MFKKSNIIKAGLMSIMIVSLIFILPAIANAEDYGFEDYLEAAEKGEEYPGLPGEGKVMGFANIMEGEGFFTNVRESIIEQAKLAGIAEDDLIIMNNDYDPDTAIRNADIMLSREPDGFIQYQADADVNEMIAEDFEEADIPILAIDVPVPGAPFMGINNWEVAQLAGEFAIKEIEEKWGGWDAVDLIVLLQNPAGGEVTMMRSEGFADAFIQEFGEDTAESKIVRTDGGIGEAGEAREAMSDVLAANPAANNIVVTTLNDQMMQGAIAALEMMGYDPETDVIAASQGADAVGQTLLREGRINGSVAYFPERYGEYAVPAMLALIEDKEVPDEIFVDNLVITPENIDEYYPE